MILIHSNPKIPETAVVFNIHVAEHGQQPDCLCSGVMLAIADLLVYLGKTLVCTHV